MIKAIDIKRFVLGSKIGTNLLSIRENTSLFQAVYKSPEKLGTMANDMLATTLVTNICKSNKTFIDIGAHIGSIIACVMQNNPSINIIAVEAIPGKVVKLRQKFPSAKILPYALGNKEDEVSFFINLDRSGYSSLKKSEKFLDSQMKEITVSMKKLDALVSLDNIDVIKIDVEGAELQVLQGASNTIQLNRSIIMFESGPEKIEILNSSKKALWQLFNNLDYEIYVPNRIAHDNSGLSQEGFIESHIYPRRTTNYFAIPNERRIEVRDRAREILDLKTA